MNEIIFKGQSSADLGILVSSLPPIIKPRQRAEIYYIDGKDGANTNNLGYESYAKTASIILKNTDNIDQIISWLDGSGSIVFSNEPDKEYYGEVIETIYFDRLVRFRTANVSWLVHPYKYIHNETPVALSTAGVNTNVENKGTKHSYPLIKIQATAPSSVYVNDILAFVVDTSSEKSKISIDSEDGGFCYNTDTNELYTGVLTGNYPVLMPGVHTIKIISSGIIGATVNPRSRFI